MRMQVINIPEEGDLVRLNNGTESIIERIEGGFVIVEIVDLCGDCTDMPIALHTLQWYPRFSCWIER